MILLSAAGCSYLGRALNGLLRGTIAAQVVVKNLDNSCLFNAFVNETIYSYNIYCMSKPMGDGGEYHLPLFHQRHATDGG